MSLTRWWISGSKPPADPADAHEHVGVVRARARGRPRPRRAATPSATGPPPAAAACPRGSVSSSSSGSRSSRCSSRQARARRVLVLLGDRDVDPAAGEQRQRLLGLELGQLDPQRRYSAASRPSAGMTSAARGGLERRRRAPTPRTSPASRASSASSSSSPASTLAGARREHAPGVGQLEPPPGLAEQLDARLALQLRELLGDRRGRERERLGGARDRALGDELAQHDEAAGSEHRCRSSQLFRAETIACSEAMRSGTMTRHARLPQLPRRRRRRPPRPRAGHVRRPAHRRSPTARAPAPGPPRARPPATSSGAPTSALGVAALLAASATAFATLKLAGAAYLAVLGVQALLRGVARRRRSPAAATAALTLSPASPSAAASSATCSTSRPACSGPRSCRSSSAPTAARCCRWRWSPRWARSCSPG